jgi:hypothetical protein
MTLRIGDRPLMPAALEDRPLGGDAALAEAALPSLAELVRAAS